MKTNAEPTEIVNLLINGESESLIIADSSLWIPFTTTSRVVEFDFNKVQGSHIELSQIQLSCIPSVFSLKLIFVKILVGLDVVDSLTLLSNLWRDQSESLRKKNLINTAELLSYVLAVLQDCTSPNDISVPVFGQSYHRLVVKTDLLKEMLLKDAAKFKSSINYVPKWTGKPMQFIELISIGIELGLFDGRNQNEICNSLLKAFQVEAESDQPIYKQRFNALFKRSKVHLPLIANYIHKVEEMKGMKIVLDPNEW